MARTKGAIADDLRRLLRALKKAGDDRERRTVVLRDLAEASVELREHYLTPDGSPDWAGKTWAYRDSMRRLYREANYSADDAKSTQAAVRYHVGNILRRLLPAEEVEDLGLMDAGPAERSRSAREERATLLQAVRAPTGDPDTVKLLSGALALVNRAAASGKLEELRGKDRKLARDTLDRLATRAEELAAGMAAGPTNRQ